MADDLSLKAKRLLATQYDKLIVDKNAVAKASSILNEVISWCSESEITPGKWMKPNQAYRFDKEYIQQINHILVAAKYANIFDNFQQDTHQSAAQRNPNEKQAHLKPTHHLVLTAITSQAALDSLAQELYSSQQLNVELDISQLKLDHYACLVVIENRDSFNDWFAFQPFSPITNALVVYRGDKYHSTACKALLNTWQRTQGDKASIYFGDYDLAGLRIAISAGYSHLLLPALNSLSKVVMHQYYPDKQQKFLSRLIQDCPIGWQALLTLMRNNRAGLRQQKMYQTPLVLYSRAEES